MSTDMTYTAGANESASTTAFGGTYSLFLDTTGVGNNGTIAKTDWDPGSDVDHGDFSFGFSFYVSNGVPSYGGVGEWFRFGNSTFSDRINVSGLGNWSTGNGSIELTGTYSGSETGSAVVGGSLSTNTWYSVIVRVSYTSSSAGDYYIYLYDSSGTLLDSANVTQYLYGWPPGSTLTHMRLGDSGGYQIGIRYDNIVVDDTYSGVSADWFDGTIDGYSDTQGGGQTIVSRSLTESVSVVDDEDRRLQAVRQTVEFIEVADLASRSASLSRAALDALGVSDGQATARYRYGRLADSAELSDTILLNSKNLNRALAQYVEATDQSARVMLLGRALNDSATVLDALQTAIIEGGITLITRALADSLDVQDNVLKIQSLVRLLLDRSDVQDFFSANKSGLIARTLNDSATVSDDYALLRLNVRELIDSIVYLSDDIEKRKLLGRLLDEEVEVQDALFKLQALVRNFVETVDIADNVQAQIFAFVQAEIFILAALQKENIQVEFSRQHDTPTEVDLK